MIATVDGVNYRGCGGMVSVATTGRAPSPTLGRSKERAAGSLPSSGRGALSCLALNLLRIASRKLWNNPNETRPSVSSRCLARVYPIEIRAEASRELPPHRWPRPRLPGSPCTRRGPAGSAGSRGPSRAASAAPRATGRPRGARLALGVAPRRAEPGDPYLQPCDVPASALSSACIGAWFRHSSAADLAHAAGGAWLERMTGTMGRRRA
jgi:hypothetical protein